MALDFGARIHRDQHALGSQLKLITGATIKPPQFSIIMVDNLAAHKNAPGVDRECESVSGLLLSFTNNQQNSRSGAI